MLLALKEASIQSILAEVALALAVMAPLASERALLGTAASTGLAGWLVLPAVVPALSTAVHGTSNPAASMRWLGWLGLLAAPVWGYAGEGGLITASLAFAAIIVVGGAVWRLLARWRRGRAGAMVAAVALTWALVAPALLVALLGRA
jgi:hypothetical protein